MSAAPSGVPAPSEAELLEVEAYIDDFEGYMVERQSRIKGPCSVHFTNHEQEKRISVARRLRVVETVRRLIELTRERGGQ